MSSDPTTPAQRFRTAMELAELAEEMMRHKLRREHPDASEDEIEQRLTAWYERRPGAEHGDAEGRPGSRRLTGS